MMGNICRKLDSGAKFRGGQEADFTYCSGYFTYCSLWVFIRATTSPLKYPTALVTDRAIRNLYLKILARV